MAREKKPAIIFIDEIDSLAGKRSDGEQDSTRRLKTEFLVQMQGVGKDTRGILTLGATNCPWDLDPAVRRRFVKRIYIPLPEKEARKGMFKLHVGKTPNDLSDDDFDILGEKTPGFSGSDINGVVQDALMEPVRTMQDATHFKEIKDVDDPSKICIVPCTPADPLGKEMQLMDIPPDKQDLVKAPPLKLEHFLRILTNCKPSVGHEDIKRHIDWTNEFGQEGV